MQTQISDDQTPKFYQILLEKDLFSGWNVIKEWGSQGTSSRVIKKHFDIIEDAEAQVMKTRDKQIKKGYRVMFIEGQINHHE